MSESGDRPERGEKRALNWLTAFAERTEDLVEPVDLFFTYTNDFHKLLYGDLRPGAELVVRYDPKRIVPEGEPYRFGDPNSPIVAHAAFALARRQSQRP